MQNILSTVNNRYAFLEIAKDYTAQPRFAIQVFRGAPQARADPAPSWRQADVLQQLTQVEQQLTSGQFTTEAPPRTLHATAA